MKGDKACVGVERILPEHSGFARIFFDRMYLNSGFLYRAGLRSLIQGHPGASCVELRVPVRCKECAG